MAARITTAQLAERIAAQDEVLGKLTTLIGALVEPQHATPAPVVEVVEPAKPVTAKASTKARKAAAKTAKNATVVAQPAAPVVETIVEPVLVARQAPLPAATIAGDALQEFVTGQDLAFAKGGRTYLDNASLEGIARVLKTGAPEIVPITSEQLNKRGIVGLAIGRDGGKGVLTQYVFDPAATRK